MPVTIRLPSGVELTVTDQVWESDNPAAASGVIKVVSQYDYSPSDGDPDTAEAEYVISQLGGQIVKNEPRPWNVDPGVVY